MVSDTWDRRSGMLAARLDSMTFGLCITRRVGLTHEVDAVQVFEHSNIPIPPKIVKTVLK